MTLGCSAAFNQDVGKVNGDFRRGHAEEARPQIIDAWLILLRQIVITREFDARWFENPTGQLPERTIEIPSPGSLGLDIENVARQAKTAGRQTRLFAAASNVAFLGSSGRGLLTLVAALAACPPWRIDTDSGQTREPSRPDGWSFA